MANKPSQRTASFVRPPVIACTYYWFHLSPTAKFRLILGHLRWPTTLCFSPGHIQWSKVKFCCLTGHLRRPKLQTSSFINAFAIVNDRASSLEGICGGQPLDLILHPAIHVCSRSHFLHQVICSGQVRISYSLDWWCFLHSTASSKERTSKISKKKRGIYHS